MTSLTLDRPVVSRLATNIFDAVLAAPERLAHAQRLKVEAERIFALSLEELDEMDTTREALLRALAARA